MGEGGGSQACTCPQLAGQPAGVIVPRWPAGGSSYPLRQAAQSTCPPLASQAAGRPAKKPGDKPAGRGSRDSPTIRPADQLAGRPAGRPAASWSAGHPSGMGVWLTIKRVTKMQCRFSRSGPLVGQQVSWPAGRMASHHLASSSAGQWVGRPISQPAGQYLFPQQPSG